MAADAPTAEAGTRGRLPRPGRRRRRAARAARARTPRTEPCAAGGAASAGAGRQRRPSPRSGQPVSLARGCVRLACQAQPGAQGAARQLDNRNGEDSPRPAGASGPRPRRPLDADGVGRPVSVEHLAVRKQPSAYQAAAGPAGPGRRWNMVERRSPPAPGGRRRPRVTSQRYGGRERHPRRTRLSMRSEYTRPRSRENRTGRCDGS